MSSLSVICVEFYGCGCSFFLFFFFNDTATTEIYTLSLHDALPIFGLLPPRSARDSGARDADPRKARTISDRKSTRLNSSHVEISYAVFCLKKKKATPAECLRDSDRHHVPYPESHVCQSRREDTSLE